MRSDLRLPRSGLAVAVALDHRGGHRALNVFGHYQCALRAGNCRQLEDPGVTLAEKIDAVAAGYMGALSAYLERASYTRVAEVALTWTPHARFGGVVPSGLTVSVEARNLATWTQFTGADPEVATATARQGLPALPVMPALPRTIGLRVELAAR